MTRILKIRFEYIVPAFFIAAAVLGAAFLIGSRAQAQAQSVPQAPSEEEIDASGITFPVEELGGCRNKNECKKYCDDSAHLTECVAFAEDHGLMNKTEAERARKFGGTLQERGGPGGCRTPQECESFCENIGNIEACLQFAEEEGVGGDDKELGEAKKIRDYIRGGGAMPGGCTSRESCEKYCGDFSHAKECFQFAKQAGFIDDEEGEHGPQNEEQFAKIQELMENGEMPGGCKGKAECDRYCNNPDNGEECLAFAEKAGFIKPEEIEMARQVMAGGGPGGCKSERECRNYCNDPAHQEDCFAFAEKHNLIRPEELKQARQGFAQLKQGLEFAPPEVAECLKSRLGENIIEDIQAERLVPGPQIGERVRECFETHGERPDPQEIFNRVPPEILECAREKFGTDFDTLQSGELEFNPEMGDVFRVCGEQMRFESFGEEGFSAEGGQGGPFGGGPGGPNIEQFLRSAPPQIAECVREQLSESGEGDVHAAMESCFGDFRPGGGFRGRGGPDKEEEFGLEGGFHDEEGFEEEGFEEEGFFEHEGEEGPFRPDPTRFRPENGATPFFGQDKGVPNPQDPILREQLKKEFESRGIDPSEIEQGIRNETEGDIRRQMESQIRGQIEGQIRSGLQNQGGFPEGSFPQGGFPEGAGGFPGGPTGGEFHPPEGGGTFSPPPSGGGSFGGNLLRAVRDVFFVLGAD
ncbi:MAG: hypothetical protein AAB634_01365 [Patescibacteria group bacterium]